MLNEESSFIKLTQPAKIKVHLHEGENILSPFCLALKHDLFYLISSFILDT